MTCFEVRTYRYQCNECRFTQDVNATYQPPPPEGWSTRTVHDCGMTGYTRYDDLCPTCTAKVKETP